jgi:hypothetical protein
VSNSLVRGLWGPYVGLSNPNRLLLEVNRENVGETSEIQSKVKPAPFNYGEVYNITTKDSVDPTTSVDLLF